MKAPIVYEGAMLFHGIRYLPNKACPEGAQRNAVLVKVKRQNLVEWRGAGFRERRDSPVCARKFVTALFE
jgi:hypothetical protein